MDCGKTNAIREDILWEALCAECGRRLFTLGCEEAKKLGADRLYISAHSSKESQATYKALGCVHAQEINQELAQMEPCDVQLEYVL